jgi:hypothetical protein
MDFSCKRCGYDGKSIHGIRRHMKRVRICPPTHSDTPYDVLSTQLETEYKKAANTSKTFKCDHCDARYKHSSNKSRHQRTCSVANTIDALQSRIQALEEELRKRRNHQTTATPNSTSINSLAHEKKDYISKEVLFKTYKKRDICILIKEIHFHPDHPENHNVRIRNSKLNLVESMVDGKWKTDHKKTVLPKMILNSWKLLDVYRRENSKYLVQELGENDYFESLVWLKCVYDQDKILLSEIKKSLFTLIISNKRSNTSTSNTSTSNTSTTTT